MDVAGLITQLGFPAGVAMFALWSSSKHEEFLQTTLRDSIQRNTEALEALKNYIYREATIRKDDGK